MSLPIRFSKASASVRLLAPFQLGGVMSHHVTTPCLRGLAITGGMGGARHIHPRSLVQGLVTSKPFLFAALSLYGLSSFHGLISLLPCFFAA